MKNKKIGYMAYMEYFFSEYWLIILTIAGGLTFMSYGTLGLSGGVGRSRAVGSLIGQFIGLTLIFGTIAFAQNKMTSSSFSKVKEWKANKHSFNSEDLKDYPEFDITERQDKLFTFLTIGLSVSFVLLILYGVIF